MPNLLGVIITGCAQNTGKIYQLTWNSDGDGLEWSILRDNLFHRYMRPVIIWVPDSTRDEITTCTGTGPATTTTTTTTMTTSTTEAYPAFGHVDSGMTFFTGFRP